MVRGVKKGIKMPRTITVELTAEAEAEVDRLCSITGYSVSELFRHALQSAKSSIEKVPKEKPYWTTLTTTRSVDTEPIEYFRVLRRKI